MKIPSGARSRGVALIEEYLESLGRALDDSPDRDEVLTSVREHIAVALAGSGSAPDVADVERVLNELGNIQDIAEFTSENRLPPSSAPARPSSPWGLVVAGALALVNLPLAFLAAPAGLASSAVTGAVALWYLRSPRHAAWASVIAVLSGVAAAIALAVLTFLTPVGIELEESIGPHPLGAALHGHATQLR